MNIAHDHKTCIAEFAQGSADEAFTAFSSPLVWQDLRTRLFAAHEVRTVLEQDAKPLKIRLRGSFDGCAATALTTYEGLSNCVNPTVSIYRKPFDGKDTPVAGPSNSGGRG